MGNGQIETERRRLFIPIEGMPTGYSMNWVITLAITIYIVDMFNA